MKPIPEIIAEIRGGNIGCDDSIYMRLLALADAFEALQSENTRYKAEIAKDRAVMCQQEKDNASLADRLSGTELQRDELGNAQEIITSYTGTGLPPTSEAFAALMDKVRFLRECVERQDGRIREMGYAACELRAERDRLMADNEKHEQQWRLVEDAIPTEFEGSEQPMGEMVAQIVSERDGLRAQIHDMCHDLHIINPAVTVEEFCAGCEKFQIEKFGKSPIAELRAEKEESQRLLQACGLLPNR